jgi:hypothetical protein
MAIYNVVSSSVGSTHTGSIAKVLALGADDSECTLSNIDFGNFIEPESLFTPSSTITTNVQVPAGSYLGMKGYAGDQENNFRVKINGKEYDLLSREEKSLALGALSNLLTADLPPNFGKQDNDEPADGGDFGGTTGGGTTTSPAGTADDTAMEPDEDEPEETEPEPDMI